MRSPSLRICASTIVLSVTVLSFSTFAAEFPEPGRVVTFLGLPEAMATATAAGAAKNLGAEVDAAKVRELFDVASFAKDMEALIVAQSGAASLTNAQAWIALPENAKFEGIFSRNTPDQWSEALGELSGQDDAALAPIAGPISTAGFHKQVRRYAARTLCAYAKSADPASLQRMVDKGTCSPKGQPPSEALSQEFVDLVMTLYLEENSFRVVRDVCMSSYPRFRAIARDSFAAWRHTNAEALTAIDSAAAGLAAKWDKGVVDSQGRGAKYFSDGTNASKQELEYAIVATRGQMCMNLPILLNSSHIQQESAAEVAELRRMRKEELGR